ncbi:MAG TPA: hypothetical protein VFO44_08755 [Steroidobacteraceae bacterium]|nr:hypothetical protein [Steroidobacteraceae bacterium]
MAFSGGSAWFCGHGAADRSAEDYCGQHSLPVHASQNARPFTVRFDSATSDYDGTYYVGKATASRPARSLELLDPWAEWEK